LANYQVVHTKLFLPKVPFPGQVLQLKKRLRRKLGVLKVKVDVENCTVFVEHDLSVSTARAGETSAESDQAVERRRQFLAKDSGGGGSVRVTGAPNGISDAPINAADGDQLRRKAAAHELSRVVNSIIGNSRVYIASEDGEIKVHGRSLKITFFGVLLVALHLIANRLDCSYVSAIPMNCSTYREIFGNYPNTSYDNGILPATRWDKVSQLAWSGASCTTKVFTPASCVTKATTADDGGPTNADSGCALNVEHTKCVDIHSTFTQPTIDACTPCSHPVAKGCL
jgi:hypothetical protein